MGVFRVGDELEDPEPWAVKGTVGGVSLVWGRPGGYKSFMAISFAVSVAGGKPWQGKLTRKGPVLYLLGEGGRALFARRVEMAAREIGLTSKDLDLYVDDTPRDLAGKLQEEGMVEWDIVSPVLIVVDTVSRFLSGNENQQEVMQAFVRNLDELRVRYGCTVVAVHHANKSGEIRGSTVLSAAADVSLHVWKDKDGGGRVLRIKADKLKDLDTEDFEPDSVKVARVEVKHMDGSPMIDEFGDLVTTLVLRENADMIEREQLAYDVLVGLAANRPHDTAVGYKEWSETSGQTASTFKRAIQGLLTKNLISKPVDGQYFVGQRDQKYFDPGENYDTTVDEVARRTAEELEE